MVKILIAYFSRSGNTEKMAHAVAKGARSVDGADVVIKLCDDVQREDMLAAGAIIVGSPTYFGNVAPSVKTMFDRSNAFYRKLEGKVGGAFTSVGCIGCGHETCNLAIIHAMLISGMIVPGFTAIPSYGPFAEGKPKQKDLEACRKFGIKIAQLAIRLFDTSEYGKGCGNV